MKTLKVAVASCLIVLALAIAAGAQGGPMGGMMQQGPQPRGIFNPIVGSGAQYEVQNNGKDKMNVEIDVVGKESVNGKDGYWLQTAFDSQMGQMMMKILMVSDGTTATVEKMVMQMRGGPAMEMPAQMARMSNPNQQAIDIRSKADKVGSESVTTPAGTFTADHYRMKDGSGDFWISEKVSPYGLIKGQGKDFNMVLIKIVSDAKDQITGTPVPFNPALLMQGLPRR